MNYINYFIKCCIRQFTKLFFKPKYFVTIIIIILVSLFLFGIDSQAIEVIDDTSVELVEMIIENENYEVQKAVEYLKKATLIYDYNSDNVLKQFFNDLHYNYLNISFDSSNNEIVFLFYNSEGISDEFSYDTIYPLNSPNRSIGENATSSYIVTDLCRVDQFMSYTIDIYGNMTRSFEPGSFYMPICMFYHNNVGLLDVQYLWAKGSTSDAEFNSIANSIIESNNKLIQEEEQNTQDIINNQKENTEKIENTITSTDYDDSVVDVDTSSIDSIDDSSSTQLFSTIFDNFSNLINDSNWDEVETINIGLPFVDNAAIVLKSDMLKNILGDSLLYTLITVAWYSIFGLYVFRFVTSLYHSIKSGNILGGFSFDNEVISSTML